VYRNNSPDSYSEKTQLMLFYILLLTRVAGRLSFFILWCKLGASGAPKYGNNEKNGIAHPYMWGYAITSTHI